VEQGFSPAKNLAEQGFSPAQTLRRFGLTLAGLIAIFFGLLLPWRFDWDPGWWPWGVSAALALASLAAPALLGPLFSGWSWFGRALAWLNVRLVLGAAFFLVFAPAGVALRLLGRDPLRLRRRPEATTYREISAPHDASDIQSALSQETRRRAARPPASARATAGPPEPWRRHPGRRAALMLELLGDLWAFMRVRKKYWLAPIIIVLLLLGALLVLVPHGSAVAPFVYTLF